MREVGFCRSEVDSSYSNQQPPVIDLDAEAIRRQHLVEAIRRLHHQQPIRRQHLNPFLQSVNQRDKLSHGEE